MGGLLEHYFNYKGKVSTPLTTDPSNSLDGLLCLNLLPS